eukprot:1103090-Amphidinium_carterae.2
MLSYPLSAHLAATRVNCSYQDQHSYALDMSCGEGNNNDPKEKEAEEESHKEGEARRSRADHWSQVWIIVSMILEGISLAKWMIRSGQAANDQAQRDQPKPTVSAPIPRRLAGIPFGVVRRPPYTPLHIRQEAGQRRRRT